jgi:hypothetical protein
VVAHSLPALFWQIKLDDEETEVGLYASSYVATEISKCNFMIDSARIARISNSDNASFTSTSPSDAEGLYCADDEWIRIHKLRESIE